MTLWSSIADGQALRAAGLFVAEGRVIVNRILDGGLAQSCEVVRVLATAAAARAMHLDVRVPALLDIHTPEQMQQLTGFSFHRGVVALVRRPALKDVESFLAGIPSSGPLVVAEHIVDVDNVGSIFRNARALGAASVLLDDTSADPLYRKAVRTSMGAVLDLSWTVAPMDHVLASVRASGWRLIGLTPAAEARPLREVVTSVSDGRVVIAIGNEGEGLSTAALEACDVCARIPMAAGADSLNVATALALALYDISAVP